MYKVLIVDDEKMIRMGMQKVIQYKNPELEEVLVAASGSEALEIIRECRPEIMITDINMTEMTGLELIEQAREIVPEQRVVVLTGYDKFEYARCCLRLRVEDFFLKPIDEDDLSAAIRKQVDYLNRAKSEEKSHQIIWRAKGVSEQAELEKCMRKLVHRKYVDESFMEELYTHYLFEQGQIMTLAILVPQICMEHNDQEDRFYAMSVKNICMDMIDARGNGVTFTDDNGTIVMVLFENDEEADVLERIGDITNILKDEFNTKPKVVVGSEVQGFQNLHISYNDAVYLLEHEKEAVRDIVLTNNVQSRTDIIRDLFAELKQQMNMNVGNTEYVLKVFNTFCKAVESYNLSVANVRKCCFEMATSVYFSYISEVCEAEDNRLSQLSKNLLCACREEACEMTRMFLEQLLGKEENVHELITKAKYYIGENLAEELSVSNIAESLFVTPNYFSRLFKRVMGEGCNEYIVRRRIEKAISLLETTTIKTGKIAMMVGYQDTNYFSLAFKKYTGKSPTKYREDIREKG